MKKIENEVLAIKSKLQIEAFCFKIIRNEIPLSQLVNLLNTDNSKLKITTAWIFSCLVKLDATILQPYYKQIVTYVYLGQLDAVNRNLLSTLNLLKPQKGKAAIQLFDSCKQLLLNAHSPLAVQVNAMYVMFNILTVFQEFYHEYIQILEIIKESEACSIQAALKHIHKSINKIKFVI